MPQNLVRRTQLAFLWIAIVPIVVAMLGWWSSLQYRDRVGWVSHTQQVLSQIDDVMLTVTTAETGQRGYLLTGHPSYLVPFNAAEQRIGDSLAQLHHLIGDNSPQNARFRELFQAVKTKMDELRYTVGLSQSSQRAAALDEVRTGKGQREMERVRAVADAMSAEEERLLQQRLDAQRETGLLMALSFGAGIIITIALLLWAQTLIGRYARDRNRAEQELAGLNAQLEQRVEARTVELRDANENLTRSNADLERFAYVASHDLQEPLRMVTAYVDLLARRYKGKLDSDADDYIHFAVDGARRMRALINDLLSYSRTGTQAVRIAPTDFESVLSVALTNLQVLLKETGAMISHDPLPVVAADENKLVLVMQNLLSNAVKFRKPAEVARVHVSAVRKGPVWNFLVEDNGIGFDPQYADKIFVIFQRLHSRNYPGTGLGLAISKRIVEAHGGHMWVESEEGTGSRFWFSLPADQMDEKRDGTGTGKSTGSSEIGGPLTSGVSDVSGPGPPPPSA